MIWGEGDQPATYPPSDIILDENSTLENMPAGYFGRISFGPRSRFKWAIFLSVHRRGREDEHNAYFEIVQSPGMYDL